MSWDGYFQQSTRITYVCITVWLKVLFPDSANSSLEKFNHHGQSYWVQLSYSSEYEVREHARFCKTVLHADVSVLSAQEMLFIAYTLSFPFQVDKVLSPLGDCGSLGKCSSGDMPHPHQPHVSMMGDWAQPEAHFGLEGFCPAMVSLHHCPGTASSINLMQRGCLSLSSSFIEHHALKRMPKLRQEGACIHAKTRTSAGRDVGEPVEITVENLRVESVQLHSHRLKKG